MLATRAKLFPIFGSASLLASLALGSCPFLMPSVPIGPLVFVNWVCFMLLGYSISPPPPFLLGRPPEGQERYRWNVWRLATVAFTACGTVAFLNAERVF